MSNHSREEYKSRAVAAMGPDLGEYYEALWQELAWLNRKWQEFVALFGTSASRIGLCNEAAPALFGLLQGVLWEDIVLHLARLIEPDKAVLSIVNLQVLARKSRKSLDICEVTNAALSACKFATDWRNRHIAHRNAGLALGRIGAKPLEEASRQSVRLALAALGKVLDGVSEPYLDSTTHFADAIAVGTAVDLLHVMRDGIDAKAERIERLRVGQYVPEDFARDRRPL